LRYDASGHQLYADLEALHQIKRALTAFCRRQMTFKAT